MTGGVVPFGKYKGQPTEVLAADPDYSAWLIAQPWFQARYGDVYNILINYGAEPQDSPEHNQMQARFLDDDWCRRLAARICPTGLASTEISNRVFEFWGWDVHYGVGIKLIFDDRTPGIAHEAINVECKPDLGDDYPSVLRQVMGYRRRYHSGFDCVLVRRYAFQDVAWEQVREIFHASNVSLISEDELADPV